MFLSAEMLIVVAHHKPRIGETAKPVVFSGKLLQDVVKLSVYLHVAVQFAFYRAALSLREILFHNIGVVAGNVRAVGQRFVEIEGAFFRLVRGGFV